ncbi:MAG: protein kinase [Cyanobacteria bacterium J06632_19]
MTTLAERYEIIEELGRGAFGTTFLAMDIQQANKYLCVVKELFPEHKDPLIINFFHKEAAVLKKLGKHPQIPQLLAHFQEDDNLYIVQEFVKGHNLGNEIKTKKQLSESYVYKLLQDVLEVLSFVHQQKVIHRDIKPANLMRREDGRIFMIDFGAVKQLESLMVNSCGEIVTNIKTVIGTPGYMPSEQKSGKPRFASDIYAVGMTAIAALTGVEPDELEEDPHTGEVIWLNQAQISSDLAKVITKMVRRHYSLRYSSATDALQALNSLQPLIPYVSTPQAISSKPQKQPTSTPAVSKVLRQKPLNLPSQPTPKPLKTALTPTIPLHNTQNDFPHRKILGFILAGTSLITVVLVSIIFIVKDILTRRELSMIYIANTMNRVQQSYYANKEGFTSNIQDLKGNIAFDTNYYSLKTVPQSNDKSVINIVQTKNKKLRSYLGLKPKSYLGLVYVTNINKNITTIAQLCVSSQSLSKPPVMPKLPQNAKENTDIKCPSGFKAIQ